MRPPVPNPSPWLLGVVAVFTACSDTPGAEYATTRDSAGVAIVDNPTSHLASIPEWTLGSPSLTLGGTRTDASHQFSQVVGAAVLADGRIVVGDAETRELRVFDPDGGISSVIAGRGEGPGELSWLHTFTVHRGDTISASAWPFGLLSRFEADGSYLDSRQIGPFWSGRTSRILQDGSLLLDYYDGGHGNNIERWAAEGEGTTFRPRGALIRAFDGGVSDTLRLVEGEEWFKSGTMRVDLWLSPTPFGSATVSAVSERDVFVGETDRAEIEVRSLDGRLARLIRWSLAPVPVTRRDRSDHADGLRAALRQPQRAAHLEKWVADAPYPETKQAFVSIAADRQGRPWVELPPLELGNVTWLVFSLAGEALAHVTVPRNARLLDIGDDYVLLLLKDELDVERIERRPIVAP